MRIDPFQIAAARERYAHRTPERERNLLRIARGEYLRVDTPERVEKFLRRRGFSQPDIDRLMRAARTPAAVAVESVGERPEPNAFERVLGTSDLMGVAFLERGLAVARTVGRIWIGVAAGRAAGYGTGFLVSPRLILTNHHVLGDRDVARRSLVEFDYQLGIDGTPSPTSSFALDADTLHVTDRTLDYALVAVVPWPSTDVPGPRTWARIGSSGSPTRAPGSAASSGTFAGRRSS